MTSGTGGNGVTISNVVETKLNRHTFNGGVGGLSSINIACLQGGLEFVIKLKSNKISPILGDTLIDYNIIPYIHITNQIRNVVVNGIKGKLKRVSNPLNPIIADYFIFTRNNPGNQITLPSVGIQAFFDDSISHRNDLTVIWSGRNDPKQDSFIPTILSNISSMVNYLENNHDNFLVISVCNGASQTEGFGSSIYSNIILLNNKLSLIFGNNYVDLRKYMVEQALYDSLIIPTNQDLIDISLDCIPTSLRSDSVHFNEIGYQMAGKYIAKVIKDKNWWLSWFNLVF